MYNRPYFKEEDKEVLLEFMRQHPFVFLTGVNEENKPAVTQVPVFIDEREGKLFLTGHIMKNSDHQRAFEQNPDVLAVFTGPHTYVSASWYTNPYMGSTWNYMSVHAKGTIRFGDSDELVSILQRLTLHYEKNNAASPTVFDNLPDEYTEKMMKAIVPFEIEITDLQHIFKLSQNRDEKSFQNIIAKLQEQGGDGMQIAAEMKKREKQLFGK
jgi:transcriptional regulator